MSKNISNNTNKPVSSKVKTFWVLQLLLAGCAVLAGVNMSGKASSASAAQAQLGEGKYLIDKLTQLKSEADSRPDDLPDARITELIEKSAAKIGLRSQSIKLISPQPASRIAQSRYGHKNTVVLLREVTIEQIAKLTHMLHVPDAENKNTPSLDNTSLRIMSPDDKDQGNLWDAEIVFSQTIIMPKDKPDFLIP